MSHSVACCPDARFEVKLISIGNPKVLNPSIYTNVMAYAIFLTGRKGPPGPQKEIVKMKKLLCIPVALSLLLSIVIAKPAKAMEKGPLSIIGPIVGAPIGGVMGLLRGFTAKAVHHSDTVSEDLGDGFAGRLIGTPLGLVFGGVAGGITGLVRGVVDGIVIGIDNPLSSESATLDGDFIDYDPYELFDGSSNNQ